MNNHSLSPSGLYQAFPLGTLLCLSAVILLTG